MRRQQWNKTMKGLLLLLALFICHVALAARSVHGQALPLSNRSNGPESVSEDTSGVEELVNVLLKNGLLMKDEAEALRKKTASGLSGLAALTELLRAKGFITPEEAGKVAKKAEAAPKRQVVIFSEQDQKRFEKMTQDVTQEIKRDVREKVKAEIKEEVLQETKGQIRSAAAPEWTKRIRFGGDVRLRYHGDYMGPNNDTFTDPGNPAQLLNTTQDRHRVRVRARLQATADVNESTEAAVRLTTGNTTNPVTTNQTMGNFENKYSVVIDLAYARWKPVENLTFWGGRIPNPFFYSNLVWYNDLTFDGIAASYSVPLTDRIKGFFTAGAFPLQEIESNQQDKWLFGWQAGVDLQPHKNIIGKLGVALYDFKNTQGVVNPPGRPAGETDYSAPVFMQKGNTVIFIDPFNSTKTGYAAKYQELNLIGKLDIGFWDPVRVVLLADYVNNIGYNRSEVRALTGIPDYQAETEGYQVGLSVGHPVMRKLGDWRFFSYYKYLERDAVMDAFTDPDFHLGGTSAKGWIFGGEVGLTKNLWTTFKWVSTDWITPPPNVGGNTRFAVDSFFLDLNCRF